MTLGRLITIPAQDVRSLVWQGDALVDWASGGLRYHLDGTCQSRTCIYSYVFDAAVATDDGEYVVIYTRFGTKGLVLKGGDIIREINRSFYHAHHYDYPVAVFQLQDGRAVIAHCPDGYASLDIEDVDTGERLTSRASSALSGMFHSRLNISPDGRWLISAGWVWHPIDRVCIFDVNQALSNPSHLDGPGVLRHQYADKSSIAFDTDGKLIIGLEGDIDEEKLLNEIRRFDFTRLELPAIFPLSQTIGRFMPIDNDYVLSLHQHPHLINLKTGFVVEEWPQIFSGNTTTSLTGFSKVHSPTIAMDVKKQRIAIVGEDEILVLDFG